MAIKDLKIREGKIDIVVEIVEKSDVREFSKFGKPGRVCNAQVKDDTGSVTLTLWNEDIDKIKVGDKVHIKNGYVGEWQGEPQLSSGRFGELEVVGGDDTTTDEANEATVTDTPKSDAGEHILTDDEKTEEEILDNVKEEKVE
jgi:ssDNA-binding replication factor A large subunit